MCCHTTQGAKASTFLLVALTIKIAALALLALAPWAA